MALNASPLEWVVWISGLIAMLATARAWRYAQGNVEILNLRKENGLARMHVNKDLMREVMLMCMAIVGVIVSTSFLFLLPSHNAPPQTAVGLVGWLMIHLLLMFAAYHLMRVQRQINWYHEQSLAQRRQRSTDPPPDTPAEP